MTDLILSGNREQITMSSREIARVVESRHDNVRRTIETLAARQVIQLPQSEEVKNHLGQTVREYMVGKRDSYVVVAQLSPEFTAKLVDRWQELEQKATASLPDFTNPAVAARAWADEVEGKQAALAQLEQSRPYVEFARQVEVSPGAISVAEAAKIIGSGQNRLMAFLRQKGWVSRRNEPYQRVIEAGYLDVKVNRYNDPDRGLKDSLTTLVTGKGLRKLQQMWATQQSLELQ
ncbi:DNA-binding protein [Streptosporangium jomthongense]|uniref:Phage antirepressor KilAC domain-containing protein n=1 Tax=Marinobacter aromaticivorans TaxID=1494078 RepID=A0ABW2IXX2_9GAMM|nr:phage antirepressor KilAC domain-containing protein [Marinobacter aromaticivorans]GGE75800.1 DNA-binding protein [Streptosporangium jomthongense]